MQAFFQVYISCWHEELKRPKAFKIIFLMLTYEVLFFPTTGVIIMPKVPFKKECACAVWEQSNVSGIQCGTNRYAIQFKCPLNVT